MIAEQMVTKWSSPVIDNLPFLYSTNDSDAFIALLWKSQLLICVSKKERQHFLSNNKICHLRIQLGASAVFFSV